MSKTAQKRHMKKRIILVIQHPEKGEVAEFDYELVRRHNVKGKCTGMWWVNKNNPEDTFKKVRGDTHVAEEKVKD